MNVPVKPSMALRMLDSLTNFLSGMGVPGRDKSVGTVFVLPIISDEQCSTAYRADWIIRKAIDIPAYDATREWRAWQAENDQIEKLEELEKDFDVVRKIFQAMSKARLYGGAALILGVKDGTSNPMKPLNLEKVGKDALQFLHVVPKSDLSCGDMITDLMDPYYGMPEYFERKQVTSVSTPSVKIHPSRVIVFKGLERPDITDAETVWGDPVLFAINDAVQATGSVTQAIAALITEAKFDIIKVPNLTQIVATDAGQKKLTDRFAYANVAKSYINALLLDKEEEWQRIQVSFGGMPEVLQTYLMITAAAVDIPATRFLSQDPKGLNATGESDIRNYYDRVASDQELKLTPQLNVLDEIIIRSALGKRDENIYYEWNPLWQMSESEKADIAKKKSEVVKLDVELGLIPITAMAEVRQNMLIEDAFYPGLEAALEKAEKEGDIAVALVKPEEGEEGGMEGEEGEEEWEEMPEEDFFSGIAAE